MKKFLTISLALLFGLMIGFSSCSKCSKDKTAEDTQDSVTVKSELVVENVTSTDRQYMFTNYGEDYRWYETCIVMQDFLDEETDGTVTGIYNVFQVVDMSEDEKSADVYVVLAAHTPDSTAYEVKNGFWVEDYPMNEDAIQVTFAQAFEKVMEVNLPKPHSRQVVLRKQIGPKACNPQYIFGNSHAQIYVDAVTGDVTDKNPAFPADLQMPLGEWP